MYKTLSQKQRHKTPTCQKALGSGSFYYSTSAELLAHFTEEETKKLCEESVGLGQTLGLEHHIPYQDTDPPMCTQARNTDTRAWSHMLVGT